MRFTFFIVAVIGATVLASDKAATEDATQVVDSLDSLRHAMKSAAPGGVIEVADGVYPLDRDLELKRLQGEPAKPIIIRAQHLLQAELTGDHSVRIRDSEYLVFEGFRFRMKADVHGKDGALNLHSSRFCQISRNDFELDERNSTEKNQTWLTVDGERSGYNRIERNRFSKKSKQGHYVFITGDEEYVSQHDLIEGNHFVDRGFGQDANEYETIRVGESRIGNQGGKSFTTIRGNLFERCQGEDEIISFKAGGCSFVDNAVVNCHGSVVFRNGNDGMFAGNIMLNTYADRPFNAYRSGGVRFYGSGHRVFNSYFQGLDGTSLKAPLALMHGAPAGSGAVGVSDGLPASHCEIVHNTWVGCAQLRLGHQSKKRLLRPQQCAFMHNIVSETDDNQLLQLFEVDGVAFRGNILHASRGKETGIEDATYTAEEFLIADPILKLRDDLFRLSPGSPAIDFAPNSFAYVDKDIDGDLRGDVRDAGADEFQPESVTKRTPLSPKKVGPLVEPLD